jgi:ArsR family transcriptional regulator
MPGTPAHRTCLDILEWLEAPVAHFPPQRRPDALVHGVDAVLVAAKLGVPRRVASSHLCLLVALGLLRTSRIRRRTYYRRDEVRIAEVARMFEKGVAPPAPPVSRVPCPVSRVPCPVSRSVPEVTRAGPRR